MRTHAEITDERKKSYLTDDVARLLVEQVGVELNNTYLYLNYSIWYDIKSYFGQAEYFRKRSNEEYKHAKLIIDYLIEADHMFMIPPTDKEYTDIHGGNTMHQLDIIEAHKVTLENEIETTMLLSAIKTTAVQEKDYITELWLKNLLLEQAEEESLSRTVLDVLQHTKDPLIADAYVKNIIIPKMT